MGNRGKHVYASYPRFAGSAKLECKHSSLAYALRAKKIAEVRYSWYHAFCYIRSIANRLQETAHIQQKATDKTLSIACCTQICTGKETIYEKDIKSLSCTAVFPDEILTCYITLYSVQCFIGFDCTELIFFLGGSSFVM